jgi:hypothetical protein
MVLSPSCCHILLLLHAANAPTPVTPSTLPASALLLLLLLHFKVAYGIIPLPLEARLVVLLTCYTCQ